MKLSKKILIGLFCAIFSCAALSADITIKIGGGEPKSSPAQPSRASSGQSKSSLDKLKAPRQLETIEGKVVVHGRNIFLETPRISYKLIFDERDPRLSYREFEKWDREFVTIEGYADNHNQEFELTKVIRPPKRQMRPANNEGTIKSTPSKQGLDKLR